MKYSTFFGLLASLFLSTVYGHDYTNIVFSPPSPASLDWEEHVTLTFNYQTEATNGIRVGIQPYSSTNFTLDDANGGSQLHTGATGSASTYFIIRSGEVVVDSVKLLMYDEVTSEILFEKLIEGISFTFPKQAGGDDAPYPHCSDTRVIPHLTKIGGVFESTIIVENFSSVPQSYHFTPYRNDGALLTGYSGSLDAGATQYLDPVDLFGANGADWFIINQDARVLVRVAFISTGTGSPAFSQERCVFSKKAFFSAGDWQNVFDGLALVNLGSQATDIVLSQYDQNNQLIHSQTIASGLVSMGKTLYVLDTDFSSPTQTRFVIESNQILAILALSGSKPGAAINYLWENNVFLH